MRASVDSMVVLGAGKTDNTLCRNLMAAKFGSESKVCDTGYSFLSAQFLIPIFPPKVPGAIPILRGTLVRSIIGNT